MEVVFKRLGKEALFRGFLGAGGAQRCHDKRITWAPDPSGRKYGLVGIDSDGDVRRGDDLRGVRCPFA